MSHEHERLSAYLDGELPAGERAEVEAHLATCAACAARLSSLAAVDGAFASLPAEAPDGYFESLPSRVSARLREEPRRPARRLPAWAWAAAAAALLVVVAPLTLRRPAPVPVPVPVPTGVTAPTAEKAASAETWAAPSTAPDVPAQAPAPPRAVVPDPPLPVGGVAAPAAVPPASPTRAESRAERADEAPVAAVQPMAVAEEREGFNAQRLRAAAEPKLQADTPADAAIRSSEGDDDEAAFRRLAATRPRTAADWRALRDAWRAFADSRPGSPRADEARVREVESLYEAWRAGGEAPDEEAFRAAARGYLARPDAAQEERVRRLLLQP